jgi:hypothetical protein
MKSKSGILKSVYACLFTGLCAALISCGALKGFRSGVEISMDRPPYYHHFKRIKVTNQAVGHLPVSLDQRIWDPRNKDTWQLLLNAMNTFLESKPWSLPLQTISLPPDESPDLFVGNKDMIGAPVGGISAGDTDAEDEQHTIVLFYRNASAKWKDDYIRILSESDAEYGLFITLGLSEYIIRQKNLLGKKELVLGTGHQIPVKWLTSLDDPVEVLHLTGALLDRNGKILRVGAEGILSAEPASFFESIIGLRNTLSTETIQKVLTEERRDDLPDKPLNYQVALQNLVANLLDRFDLIIK